MIRRLIFCVALLLIASLGKATMAQCPGGVCPPSPSAAATEPSWARSVGECYRIGPRAFVRGGSCVLVAVDGNKGLAVTNRHVTELNSRRVTHVSWARGQRAPVTRTWVHGTADLAAMEVESAELPAPAVFAESATPAYTGVSLYGYPLHRWGRAGKHGTYMGRDDRQELSLSITPENGDSGGGLFRSSDGRLLGIVWGRIGQHGRAIDRQVCADFVQTCWPRLRDRLRPDTPRQEPYPVEPDTAPSQPSPVPSDVARRFDRIEQLLAELSSRPGTPGPPGIPGPQGPQGPRGPQGPIAPDASREFWQRLDRVEALLKKLNGTIRVRVEEKRK